MSVDFLALISVALLSSFTHCYAMCSGLNLAFLRLNAKEKSPLLLSLTYHSFRILAYIFLGLVFSSFGNVISHFSQSLLFFMLGVFMVLLGLAMFVRGNFLAFFERNFIFHFLREKMLKKFHFKGYKNAMFLGFLNGFVPCGLVYFYLALSMSQKNLFYSALIMFVFGLCTLPALLFLNFFSRFLNEKLGKIYLYLTYGIIIVYGVYYLYLALKFSR
ncbi:hypothetical protein DMB95_06340 [Campylobacter sp. MIT 12-8780]|uniref:sulfite exporter TauE/SafE family protein n=1 Tax=unclassified Campylobacter TaxID=2593542 RepID=UPI00115C5B13|nr:sulfite exporter TauE/SafE family protein [Campylobacter sp. MIT 12-8780]NDJ27584.1 sulfite exporter TauE/SafE family protein [Campylobacter sp. MIT 19-121]TQR40755.1 hypothetical protein DMB95_06340 [Campylobacter sp. MIT 12-8780]